MPPKRRQRIDPFEDAKDAVNNKTSMNERDRHQLFATSLLELSKTQTCDLTLECINVGWTTGITLAISALSVEDIAERSILDYIISRPNLDEETKVDILTLFLVRNCSVNTARPATLEDDYRYFVYADKNHGVVWKNEGGYVQYGGEDGDQIHFVQTVIRYGLVSVLRRISSKLDVAALKLALAESIGSNSKDCYEVLVSRKDKLEEFDLEVHAILYAACYGRAELLSTLLNDASETALRTLKTHGMNNCGEILPLDEEQDEGITVETILEHSARRGHAECSKLIIQRGLLKTEHFDQNELLIRCVKCNHNDCAKLLLKAFDSISFDTLANTILHDLLQSGLNAELCLAVIDKMHQFGDERNTDEPYLHSIFFGCYSVQQFGGLFILASNSATVIRSNTEMRKDAEKTLNALVLGDHGKSKTEIIKHLILIPEIDLLPSFEHVVLRSKDIELVEFFLSLNNKVVCEAAQKLKSSVRNEKIKKMLEDSEMKIKVEAAEEVPIGKKSNKKKK